MWISYMKRSIAKLVNKLSHFVSPKLCRFLINTYITYFIVRSFMRGCDRVWRLNTLFCKTFLSRSSSLLPAAAAARVVIRAAIRTTIYYCRTETYTWEVFPRRRRATQPLYSPTPGVCVCVWWRHHYHQKSICWVSVSYTYDTRRSDLVTMCTVIGIDLNCPLILRSRSNLSR